MTEGAVCSRGHTVRAETPSPQPGLTEGPCVAMTSGAQRGVWRSQMSWTRPHAPEGAAPPLPQGCRFLWAANHLSTYGDLGRALHADKRSSQAGLVTGLPGVEIRLLPTAIFRQKSRREQVEA